MQSISIKFPGFALCLALSIANGADPLETVPPTPAGETAKDFKLLDGFKMTLLAAEPLVTDPVAICYDADGRAYVAEMNDYPYTDKARHKPMQENPTDEAIGKVRLLEDLDGDGKFDKATIFADGLSWPTGITPWKGGVYVTAAPDLWYLKDTDGDGKADVREKILTGYRKYNVQAEVNNPIWGLDHRIYIASASNGGKLYAPADGPDSAIELGRQDIRLDPAGGNQFERITGGIQFGNTFDDWGNRFLSSNSRPVLHAVMPLAAFDRNPWLPSRRAVQLCTVPDAPIQLYPVTAIEGWRLQRYKDREFVPRKGYKPPRGENPGEPSSPTSSSAPVIYRGDAYPDGHRGAIFVAEPCYNLIYHLDRKEAGATFTVTKPQSDGTADFVASTDVWFRPTNFVNAPDGCLHITDLYREAIEHPWSLPEAFHARMDLERGRDRGRIYRLEPPEYEHRPAPKLSRASIPELVALLEHPNVWRRDTAHRLLFERQDKSAIPLTRDLFLESGKPLGRLHALWTLHGLDALDDETLKRALSDPSPGVRANAAKLATLGLQSQVAALADDPDPTVRFQTALALGAADANDSETARALVAIARKDATDPWTRLAVLSSSVPHASAMLSELLADDEFLTSPSSAEILQPLAQIVGAHNQAAETSALISKLTSRGKPDAVALATTNGLATGLRLAKSNLATAAAGEPYLTSILAEARTLAANPNASIAERSSGIALLRNGSFDEVGAFLRSLLDPAEPTEIQSAAAAALSAVGGRLPEVSGLLLQGWDGYGGELRSQIVQLLLARPERLGALLDALEAGQIQPYQIGVTRRELLLAHSDQAVRDRAEKLFAGAASRADVLKRYQEVPSLQGDPAKGETVYQTVCIACHKFRDKGIIDLAPNLAAVADWEPDRILTNILDPNREVAPEYMETIVETESGAVLIGRIVAESSSGVTLRMADNSTRDIPRGEIAKLRNSGRSLMPEGLEAAIPPQAMADLLAYLLASGD